MNDEDTKKLMYGETPFDKLTREELILHCQRMYEACSSMYSVINLSKINDSYRDNYISPFWTKGSGAQALEMGKQCLDKVQNGFSTDNIYHAFFRYARDLLFDSPPEFNLGFSWYVCNKCNRMIGADNLLGTTCRFTKDCDGIYRSIVWSDIRHES